MGEFHRQKQAELRALPPHKRPASEAQLNYLRALCLEADNEADEEWLKTLTAGVASQEIGKRTRKG